MVLKMQILTLRRMGKKAMMKTIEAFIAAFLAFTFIIATLPANYEFRQDTSGLNLRGIEKDYAFRNCVIAENSVCINSKIRESIYGMYNYTYQIIDDPQEEPAITIPDGKVNVFSVAISGNYSHYDPKIFKLYYWIE
jgi:hypothetical protein